jgi:hypothetical protein
MRKPNKSQLISIAVTAWMSFLSASVATMLFFASFDPAVIAQLATYPMQISRGAGYTIGFLLFWVLLVINSLFVILLLRDKSK